AVGIRRRHARLGGRSLARARVAESLGLAADAARALDERRPLLAPVEILVALGDAPRTRRRGARFGALGRRGRRREKERRRHVGLRLGSELAGERAFEPAHLPHRVATYEAR